MKSSKRVSVKPEVVVDHRSFMRTDMSNAKDSALLHVQQGEPVFGKNLEIPRTNSSMSQERLIQTALRDIAKLPEKIEQSVSLKVAEPAYQKAVLSKVSQNLVIGWLTLHHPFVSWCCCSSHPHPASIIPHITHMRVGLNNSTEFKLLD